MIDDNNEISINNFDINCFLRKIVGYLIINILNWFLQSEMKIYLKI